MRCHVIQRYLLELDRPDRPPEAVRGHLEQCAACHAFHRQLLGIERLIPQLPVPSARVARAAFLKVLPSRAANGASNQTEPSRPGQGKTGWQTRERAVRKLALAAALAAALLLFALGWWLVQQAGKNQPNAHDTNPGSLVIAPRPGDPDTRIDVVSVTERIRDRYPQVQKAQTPRERVETFGDVADRLFVDVQKAQGTEKGPELVSLYIGLVRDLLPLEAKGLTRDEKLAVLEGLIGRLATAESKAKGLAEQLSAADAQAMQQLAVAAAEGRDKLRKLVNEA